MARISHRTTIYDIEVCPAFANIERESEPKPLADPSFVHQLARGSLEKRFWARYTDVTNFNGVLYKE